MCLAADNERPEWEALLAAIADADRTFTFAEIGAGYGRWTLRAHELAAARDLDSVLVAVEAEPGHFRELETALVGIPVTLVHAAVSHRNGHALFGVGLDDCYGQQVITGPRVAVNWLRRGGRIRRVPLVQLDALLAAHAVVDLVDLDVQGAEADILEHAALGNVRRIHVGTHSRDIEKRLRNRFEGWTCEAEFSGEATQETPWGRIAFEDGAQTWVNMHA